MDPTDINPLTKAQLANLRKALFTVNSAQLQIDKAEAAGLDMQEETLRCAHQRERLERLLRAYGNQS